MPRKKKIESLPFPPSDAATPVNTSHVTDLPPESLLDQALAHYGLRSSDVFAVRSVAPGVVRIIMRDARKFTYPPQET